MIPFSPNLKFSTLFNSKKNYWKVEEGQHHFFLSRSSWSILTICLFKQMEFPRRKITLLLPEYFCYDPLPLLNDIVYVKYYQIDDKFNPILKNLNEISELEKPDIFLSVHYFGQPVHSNELKNFCIKNKCWHIEDATHCLKRDRIIGSQGDFILFSPYKHVALPDGAILITNSKGPSKLDIEPFKKIDINQFLKKQLSERNFDKSLKRNNSNWIAFKWIFKQMIYFFFKNTKLLDFYLTKNYLKSLEPNQQLLTYSFKISRISNG